jgi:glutaconate CoA-transferase, subunit A
LEGPVKVRTIEQAGALVPDGATVAIGGLSMNSTPMAFVRALARRGVRDLTLVAIVQGMAVDWLVAAGCVRRVISGLVSFEGLGLAPRFRAAVQSGEVAIDEYSEHTLICALQAATYGLPFMPTRAGIGTDMLDLHPDTTRLEVDGPTGRSYVACTPLPVDVAVVHAHAADELGNVRVDPKLLWMDNEIVNAATLRIATVERIVPPSAFVAAPHRTTYPRFMIDAVVESPWGAYPSSMFPDYTHDRAFFEGYSSAALASAEDFAAFWDRRVVGPESHGDFLDANGGAATLLRIRRRRGDALETNEAQAGQR